MLFNKINVHCYISFLCFVLTQFSCCNSIPENYKIYEIRCKKNILTNCSIGVIRSFYVSEKCRVLKEFKSHSHVICQSTSNLEEGQDFIIRELNLQAKVPSLRERRHSIIDPMDMRDFLDPDKYHRYDNIVRYLKDISSRFSFVELLDLGQTHENRSILGVKIGWSKLGVVSPSVVLDGGMHGREWISPATALFVIGKLVKMFKTKTNPAAPCKEKVLRMVDWFVVPLVNPDGYEYTHTEDRFWRKNRRPPPQAAKCHGVDLNRNFHVGYGLGASTDSCSEVYQGPEPASEPETRALMTLGERLNSSLLYYVSLHAYGQSWLTPWGFKTEPVTNMKELEQVAMAAAAEMECSYGQSVPAREYEVGAAADIYYVAGGASDDWFYDRTSTKFSYTIELPDDGREFGFQFPASLAAQTGQDIWTSLSSLALHILALS